MPPSARVTSCEGAPMRFRDVVVEWLAPSKTWSATWVCVPAAMFAHVAGLGVLIATSLAPTLRTEIAEDDPDIGGPPGGDPYRTIPAEVPVADEGSPPLQPPERGLQVVAAPNGEWTLVIPPLLVPPQAKVEPAPAAPATTTRPPALPVPPGKDPIFAPPGDDHGRDGPTCASPRK